MAAESDLEVAFRLQLQEAMASSLTIHQPPSSQSPPTISINNSGVNLQTEKKNLQVVNLNRPIHDQKPPLQILQTPHNFKRPYGECPSSSKSEDINNNQEVFKVYFKGLLSEERVKGPNFINKTITMAGIGVAIFNSKDEIIFEMKKPLDIIKADQMSSQSVEGQALVEALKVATDLKLNRIVFYCDHHPLYQCVSGKWRPKQQKIVNFLDQVNLLRKSFTYCEPSLIARKDAKVVFNLAREAINSHRSEVVTSQGKLENCVICLDDKSTDQFLSTEGCTHRYCYSCVKQHVEVKLLSGVLPKCPHEGCGIELRIESCEKFLAPKFTEMMRQRLKEESIPVTEKFYCPYPKCSTLMSKAEVERLPISIIGFGARTCCKCHGSFCIKCRVPWHENMTCAEYKRRNPTPVVEESKLKNLAARNLWRQCIKCKHMIELAAGCYHMTCRCGYEFCYTCGAEWKNKKATCNCPLWVEENIVNAEEEDNEDDGFIGFAEFVLEDDAILEDDVPEDDFMHDVPEGHYFEDDDFEHDVPEDVYLGDDVLEDDAFDDVPEDVYLGDDAFDDVLEDDAFDDVPEDVYLGDDVLEDDAFDDVPEDVYLGDDVLEDDAFDDVPEDVYLGDDVLEDDAFDDVYEDEYGDFEHDVPEDEYDDDFW